jgi:hypothetical protein
METYYYGGAGSGTVTRCGSGFGSDDPGSSFHTDVQREKIYLKIALTEAVLLLLN